MRIKELVEKSDPCWKGYKQIGMKKKGGRKVPNCVPANEAANPAQQAAIAIAKKKKKGVAETTGDKPFDTMMNKIKKGTGKQATADRKEQKQRSQEQARNAIDNMFGGGNPADKLSIRKKGVAESISPSTIHKLADRKGIKWDDEPSFLRLTARLTGKAHLDDLDQNQLLKVKNYLEKQDVKEDWNKVNHHDKTNGLSQKAVNAYRHEHPGSHLQTAVTTKPSKLKAGSKSAKRRKSFCARMSGNKGPMKKPNGKPTPKALALRRWHCESLNDLLVTARERIYEAEGDAEGLEHLTPHLAKDILDQIDREGVDAIVKSIKWGDGGAEELIDIIKRELRKVADS